MDKRKIILSFIGVLLIVLAAFGAKAIIDSNVKEVPEKSKVVKNVFVETVENRNVPIVVPANGNVTALKKLELFLKYREFFSEAVKILDRGNVINGGRYF